MACGGSGGSDDASMDRPSSDTAPAGTVGLGGECLETGQCSAGLYCADDRRCRAAGTGGDGDSCDDSGDCQRGFICSAEPSGRVCREAGGRMIGEPCIRDDQCAAGLYCTEGTCSSEPPPEPDAGPMGRGCEPGDDCDDGNACTNDQCIADSCVNTLADGDEDGYASTIIGSCGLDCCDRDPDASPDQEGFFDEPHAGNPPLGRANFDWNCDGTEEPEFPVALGGCLGFSGCTASEGWLGAVPTRCGQTGAWASCEDTGAFCRLTEVEPARTQRCR